MSQCTLPGATVTESQFKAARVNRRWKGFTLVELLVAMALIVLIMSIISQAFVEGLAVFR